METERPLSIRLPDDLHRAAKAWAAIQGVTMQQAFGDRIARMIARRIGWKPEAAATNDSDGSPDDAAGQSTRHPSLEDSAA